VWGWLRFGRGFREVAYFGLVVGRATYYVSKVSVQLRGKVFFWRALICTAHLWFVGFERRLTGLRYGRRLVVGGGALVGLRVVFRRFWVVMFCMAFVVLGAFCVFCWFRGNCFVGRSQERREALCDWHITFHSLAQSSTRRSVVGCI